MSTVDQLSQWAAEHIGDSFCGIFMSDQLAAASRALHAARGKLTRSVILNYDSSFRGGSHWVAVRIDPDGLYYFDSFGQAPDRDDRILREGQTHFAAFCEQEALNAGKTGYKYNKIDFQAYTGDTCGHYCAYFCKYGPPDPKNSAWEPIFEAGGVPPERPRGILGIRRVDQSAAARRDAEVQKLVVLRP